MEKYCTSCGRVLGDVDFTHCPYCGGSLSEREGRQSISNRLRHEIFKRDGYRCRECGASVKDGATLEIDHILPVANGGTNDINNLQTLCKKCNRGKYTDEWVGGETDLEVAENEYQLLLDKKKEYEQKLTITTNEDDIIDYRYNIKKIDEVLPDVENKINMLRLERTKILREQEKKERKNKLYKKLYVTITESQLELLHWCYKNIEYSRDAILSYLVNKYHEDEIYQKITNLENKKNLFNKLFNNLTEFQLKLLFNYFKNIDYRRDSIVEFLVDNYSEEEIYQKITDLENKEKFYDKLSNNLNESQLKLLFDHFKKINRFNYVDYKRDVLIKFLVDNYSENEINEILGYLMEVNERKEELYNTLTDNQLKTLSNNDYDIITDSSKRKIIEELFEKYSLSEIDIKINKLKEEELRKEKLFKKLYIELTEDELKLLIKNFSNYDNYSKTEIIHELCDKYSEKEIYQIINKLQKKEEQIKNQYLNKIHRNINDSNFKLLSSKFNYAGSKEEFADYLITNFSNNEFDQIFNESQKEIIAMKLNNDDESLELLSNTIYRGNKSREEYINYIIDNYSEYEINQKISQSRIEKKEKEQVLNELSGLTDEKLKALYLRYPKFDNSKEKLINFLYKVYSVKQIYSLLDEIQEQLDNQMDENLLKECLTPERMELMGLLDSSYKDENYQKMVDMLLWNYDEKQIIEIFKELDDIIKQLDEIEKQKTLSGFCILGFVDIWYYYYIDSSGVLKRFYAFSSEELEKEALSKNLSVYKNFKSNIISSYEFINKIRSKINVEIITPHENYYYMCSKDFNSKDLKKEVMVHLGSFSEQEPSDNIFKIIVPKSSLNDNVIICPNCKSKIQKKVVRCKYCKTMMKDLLKMVDNKLELYGLNPEEIELV